MNTWIARCAKKRLFMRAFSLPTKLMRFPSGRLAKRASFMAQAASAAPVPERARDSLKQGEAAKSGRWKRRPARPRACRGNGLWVDRSHISTELRKKRRILALFCGKLLALLGNCVIMKDVTRNVRSKSDTPAVGTAENKEEIECLTSMCTCFRKATHR